MCDQCFLASTSCFNQDIISPLGPAETGAPSPFFFFFFCSPCITFCLALSPSTLKCEHVIQVFPVRGLPRAKVEEKVFWCKKEIYDWERSCTCCRAEGKAGAKHTDRGEQILSGNINHRPITTSVLLQPGGFICRSLTHLKGDFDTCEQRQDAKIKDTSVRF